MGAASSIAKYSSRVTFGVGSEDIRFQRTPGGSPAVGRKACPMV
jgi:hypothetical protein